MTKTQNLETLAQAIGAELVGAGPEARAAQVRGVAPLDKAGPGEISFLTNPRYAEKLKSSKATAIILAARRDDLSVPQLIHKNPYAAMAKASMLFYERKHTFQGQSDLAQVHPTAKIHVDATLYPFCYVDAGVEIGAGSIVYPHVYLGANVKIGVRTTIFASVTVMEGCTIGDDTLVHAGSVIGGDGFGFAPTREGIEKIPQIGGVRIGNDCEIGPLNTVDRGALTDTVVGRGCKFDSQVHIAHGVEMGDWCMIAGGGAIAGSTKLGNRVIMAGHTAVGPSLVLPDGVILGPKAGLTRSPETGGEYMGMPAVPAKDWRRQVVALEKLPELLKTVAALKREVEALKGARGDAAPAG